MYDRPGLVCVLTFCAVLLAACGGGGGGGNAGIATPTGPAPTGPAPTGPAQTGPAPTGPAPTDPMTTDPTPTDPMTTDPTPSMLVTTYGGYGAWNLAVQAAIPALSDCVSNANCVVPLPAAPGPIVSPFGATAAFDPATDNWVATWTGDIAGYRNGTPDEEGPLTQHWVGTAFLEIKAATPSTVQFWTEDAGYLVADGRKSGIGPGELPDNTPRGDPPVNYRWEATLSTTAGQKGYFSSSRLWGQFSAGMTGAAPSTAIGHIDGAGHKATFTVEQE